MVFDISLDNSPFHYRLADRDMFMRFHGGSVGHKATNHVTKVFLADATADDVVIDDTFEVVAADDDDDVEQDDNEDEFGFYTDGDEAGEEEAPDLPGDDADGDPEDQEGQEEGVNHNLEGYAAL